MDGLEANALINEARALIQQAFGLDPARDFELVMTLDRVTLLWEGQRPSPPST